MRKYIEKTLNILDELYEKITQDLKYNITFKNNAERLQAEITRHVTGAIGSWLIYEKEAIESKLIFDEISLIIPYIEGQNLNKREYIDLIFYIVKRNIQSGLFEGTTYDKSFTEKSLSTWENRIYGNEKVISNIKTWESNFIIYCTVYKNAVMIPEAGTTLKRINMEKIPNYTIEELQEYHMIIQKHYFDKINSYNEEDIKLVTEALFNLYLSESTCIEVYQYLSYEMKKRKTKKKVVIINDNKNDDKKSKLSLSKKEYNTIYNELLTYFDFNNMKPIKFLTLDEIIYCLYLLQALNCHKDTMNNFLRIIEKYNKKQNPLSLYSSLYNKIKLYEEDSELSSKMLELESYLKEMFITNDEDYLEWKKLFNEELLEIINILPKNYNYEFNETQKLTFKLK